MKYADTQPVEEGDVSLEARHLSVKHLQVEMTRSQLCFIVLCHTDQSSVPWPRGGQTHMLWTVKRKSAGAKGPITWVATTWQMAEQPLAICPSRAVWLRLSIMSRAVSTPTWWPSSHRECGLTRTNCCFPIFHPLISPLSFLVFHLTVPGKWNCPDDLSLLVL